MKIKVSDYIVRFFEQNGLRDIFMVSGGGCMHLVDSFGKSKSITYWCTEHEQAAAFAAEGYAKNKNDICAVLVTCGPGATNTITGVLDCYQDSTPVVFISGQAKTKQTVYSAGISGLRQFGVQEANIIPIVESITKYAIEITDPKTIRFHLEKALWLAKSGRPGPVWISVPLDVQGFLVDDEELTGFDIPECNQYDQPNDSVDKIIGLIKQSKRPVIIGGHGIRIAGATATFKTFVEQTKIPVVMPFMGIDVLPDDSISNIGRIGTKGTRAGNFALQNADLVISIGSRLSVSSTGHDYDKFAPNAKIVVIDVDEVEHKKNSVRIDYFIHLDAKPFINCLVQKAGSLFDFGDWLITCINWKRKYPVVLKEYNNDSKGLNYYKFIDLLCKYSDERMPIVSDAGSAFYVTSQAVKLKGTQRYITTGGTATMGFTLPGAIGISICNNGFPVLGITGDGSFMQNLQELEVVKYHNLNIKLFVMNNNGYFSIHQTQKKFFSCHFVGESKDSGVSIVNIEKISNAFGIKYKKIATIFDSENLLKEILLSPEPMVIEVMVTTDMEVIPTNASKMNKDGRFESRPLEDMYPFLPSDELKENMVCKRGNKK